MGTSPSWIHTLNAFPTKMPANYLDIEKLILTLIGKGQRPRTVHPVPKNKVAGRPLPDFKPSYKALKNQDSVVLVKE